MKQCFSTKNLITQIAKFLPPSDIFRFSLAKKEIYIFLNTEKNSVINSIFRETINNYYYDIDKIDNNLFEKDKEDLFDDCEKTKTNWKKELKKIFENKKALKDIEVSELVYKFFSLHCYLPDLRKTCSDLEFECGSTHLINCYDFLLKRFYLYAHYDKYIKDNEILPIKFHREKPLVFGNELKDFEKIRNEFMNDSELKNVLELIYNCSYKQLNDIYENEEKRNKYINNKFIIFILWLTFTISLFSNFIYKYIQKYENSNDDRKMIYEFNNKHSGMVNFGLLLNQKFEDINVLVNYLYMFVCPEKKSNETTIKTEQNKNKFYGDFSLYKMLMTIEKETIYDGLKMSLNKKFCIILRNYYTATFKKILDKGNNCSQNSDTNNTMNDSIENTRKPEEPDYPSDNEEDEEMLCDNDNMDIEEEEDENTEKDLCDGYINSVLDYSINELNANVINHTDIKLKEDYLDVENIVINILKDEINNIIQSNIKASDLLEIIKSFTEHSTSPLGTRCPLSLIRRTRLRLLHGITISIQNFVENEIKNELNFLLHNPSKLALLGKRQINKLNLFGLYDNIKEEGQKLYETECKELEEKLKSIATEYIYRIGNAQISNSTELIINCYLNSDKSTMIYFTLELLAYYYKEISIFLNGNYIVYNLVMHKKRGVTSNSLKYVSDKNIKRIFEKENL